MISEHSPISSSFIAPEMMVYILNWIKLATEKGQESSRILRGLISGNSSVKKAPFCFVLDFDRPTPTIATTANAGANLKNLYCSWATSLLQLHAPENYAAGA